MAVIRQRTQVFNQPVGVVRADAGAASVGQAISRAAGRMAELSFQEAAKDAQKKGIELAQAVEEKKLRTFNPETGKPEAYTPPESFGTIAADAYQSVIDKRFEDSMATELKLKAQELSLNYQFNAEAYDEVMSDYIGSMAENAEGKYKAFIESTGTKFLALTKLNIQERAVARARANAAQSIIVGIDDGADNAYATALAGGYMARDGEQFSEAALIRDREVGNASNGITSGLIKAGADTRANQQINESIARGAIEHIMSKTYSSSERNAVIRALRTRGNQLGGVPQNLQDEVRSALEFIDASNVESVLSHGSTVSADYNAVERDIAAQQKAAAEAAARRAEISYSNSMLDYSTQAASLAYSAFNDEDEAPFMVSTAIGIANDKYGQFRKIVDDRFAMDQITSAERESDLREARQEALRPMLIQAAGQGNVQEFRVALNTRNPDDMARLTSQQREFISAIHRSDIFLPEDIGFAREVLSASDNEIRNRLERLQLQYSTSTAVTNAVGAAQQGALAQDDLDKIISDIRTSIGPNGLTADQALSEESRLKKGFALGIVEMFSSDATSSDMNNLATYIESNGQRTEGMSQAIIDAGNEVLQATTEEQRGEVISKIKSLKTTIDANEQEIKDEIELMQNQKRILGGNGSPNDPKDRQLTQEMLEFHGIDISKFFSYPEAVKASALRIMRSAPPQNLIDFLGDITSGVEVQDAENYLKLFDLLAQDPTQAGIFGSRFGKVFKATEIEMLRDINRVRTIAGGNAVEIAQTFVSRINDPTSKRRMTDLIGDGVKFVADHTGDSFIASELGPVAEYMVLTGKTLAQVEDRIDQIVDQQYPKSRHIVDPSFPVGSITRSRYALSRHFPEKEERMAFLQHIAASLPKGYQLVPNLDAGEKKVYLRPDDTTAEVRYFAYFVDENKELRPLIFDRDGERYFPSFSKADIADYYAEQARKEEAELERLSQEQQGVFQRSKLLKKRPGIRSADPFGR